MDPRGCGGLRHVLEEIWAADLPLAERRRLLGGAVGRTLSERRISAAPGRSGGSAGVWLPDVFELALLLGLVLTTEITF